MTDQPSMISHHLTTLDGLRGSAIIMVLGLHLDLIRGGFIGVDLFFVLSGFLITNIIQYELQTYGCVDYKMFFIKRLLRLVPALIVCVSAVSIYAIVASQFRSIVYAVLTAMTYSMNYAYSYGFVGENVLGHTWSLAVEMQFYLIWPFLFSFLFVRLSYERTLAALVVLGVTCGIWRAIVSVRYGEASVGFTYRLLETRADPLIFGGIVALLLRRGVTFRSGALFAASWSFIALVLWRVPAGRVVFHELGFTVTGLAAAYIVGFLASVRQGLIKAAFENPVLCYIGRISYGVYLYHFPIAFALKEQDVSEWQYSALFLTLLSAAFSSHFIERPFLHLKRRFRFRSKISI